MCVCVCVCGMFMFSLLQLLPICLPGDTPLISVCHLLFLYITHTHTHTHTHTQHDDKNIEDHLTSVQQLALTITIDKVS